MATPFFIVSSINIEECLEPVLVGSIPDPIVADGCPENQSKNDNNACACTRGYYLEAADLLCKPCAPGYFKENVLNESNCSATCASYFGYSATSMVGAMSYHECYCVEGSVMAEDGSGSTSCQSCPTQCTVCPGGFNVNRTYHASCTALCDNAPMTFSVLSLSVIVFSLNLL